MIEVIKVPLKDINLNDSFFDSLRNDYPGFDTWFKVHRASNDKAYITYNSSGNLGSFLLLKFEPVSEYLALGLDTCIDKDVLKIASFKVLNTGKGIGSSYLEIISNIAKLNKVGIIYTTVYPKYNLFINFLEYHGFEKSGSKDKELVLKKLVKADD